MLRRPRHLGGDATSSPVLTVVRHFEPSGAAAYPDLPPFDVVPADEDMRQGDSPRARQDDLLRQGYLRRLREEDLRRQHHMKAVRRQGAIWFTEAWVDYVYLKQALLKLFLVIVFFKYVHSALK